MKKILLQMMAAVFLIAFGVIAEDKGSAGTAPSPEKKVEAPSKATVPTQAMEIQGTLKVEDKVSKKGKKYQVFTLETAEGTLSLPFMSNSVNAKSFADKKVKVKCQGYVKEADGKKKTILKKVDAIEAAG